MNNIPHMAIRQQQTHLMNNHRLWKKHVPPECSIQSQKAKKLTAHKTRPVSFLTQKIHSHLTYKFQFSNN